MLILLLLQLGVPLLMLLSLALVRPSSGMGLALKVIATGAWLLAIGLTGLWTILPWWTPRALGVVLAVITIRRLATFRRLPAMPARVDTRVGAVASLVVALAALLQSAAAIRGRSEPPGLVADIANPLRQGTFLVVNGGSNGSVNAHVQMLWADTERYRPWRGQSHGVDLIRIGTSGFRARGLRPADPSAYLGFGSAVLAPCTGSIMHAVDGVADNIVPQTDREQMAGNYVIVRCEEFDVVLAHLRQGSVTVSSGEHVTAGHPIGELGNSGNSDEPHLHIHAQRGTSPNAPFSAEPVPLRIEGRFPVRNQRLTGRFRQ